MKNKVKPTFFIVGAPRSGTTAMYEYLRPHPEVFMAPYKEPHYFATDLKAPNPWLGRFRDRKNYLELFEGANKEKQTGEASVLYLFSKTAARNIKKFNPDAKIVILLRSPLKMVYSLYYQLFFAGEEHSPTLEKALSAEKERKRGIWRTPKSTLAMKEFFYYRELTKYGKQVKQYYDVFDKDQIHVIIFEDLAKDTAKVYKRLLSFLGLNQGFKPEFKIINASQLVNNKMFKQLIPKLVLLTSILGYRVSMILRPAYFWLERSLSKKAKRPKVDPKLAVQLNKEFLPEVRKLSKIIGRDVTFWCK